MNIFQKRIKNLCDEIIGRILALMRINSVSEVILTDNDNPVFVIRFDKTGDPCECSVHKVTAVGEGITLEVHDRITGESYKVASRYEAALANPVWLNEILEAVTAISPTKDTGLEKEVMCCNCGGNHVICDAFINPNTKMFCHYADKSFLYGWCESCDDLTVLSDKKAVKRDMENGFKEFVGTYERNPELVECIIIWKDSLQTEKVTIALTDIPEESDDAIFFYCESLSDLKSLADYGKEDFIITECIEFTSMDTLEEKRFTPDKRDLDRIIY